MIGVSKVACMCNLCSVTTNIEAIRAFVRDMQVDFDAIGNLPPQTGVFPDYLAPIVRNFGDARELTKVRWGMPSSSASLYEAAKKRAQKIEAKQGRSLSPDEFKRLVEMEPDGGTTNVRNTSSAHWKRWLTPEFRCVVPFTSFSEFNREAGRRHLVRLRRYAPPGLFRRHMGAAMDQLPQNQGRRGDDRPLRFPDCRGER